MAATVFHVDVNGTRVPVIFEQEKRLPLTSLELVFRDSGSLAESVAATASMSAALLNEGTKKEGSSAFATALDNHAVSLHADTGRETLVISLEALDSEFDFAIQKLKELLSDPNYTDEAFKKVQTEALGRLARKESDFDYLAGRQLKEILFAGTPLEHPPLGTNESIHAMTLEDLKKYISSHLSVKNLIVVAGGKIQKEDLEKIVRQTASILSQTDVEPIADFSASGEKKTKKRFEQSDQAYIYFGAPYSMESNSSERVFGKVAAFILGSGGFGSRIMEEIRVRRGLAYSAYARLIVNRTHSYLSGYLQTKLESEEEARKAVAEVIEEFVKNGVTQKELNAARKFFLGSEPLRTETLSQRMNRAFHEYYDGRGLGYSKKELDMIEKMSLKEMNAFIKKHAEIADLSWSIVTRTQ